MRDSQGKTMRDIKTAYQNTFCFKAPVINGEFTGLDLRKYANVLEDIRIENEYLKSTEYSHMKYVVRKRFRGPRAKYGRKGILGQSMCLKAHGTYAAVYVYLERR